jgi:hypothetical protein
LRDRRGGGPSSAHRRANLSADLRASSEPPVRVVSLAPATKAKFPLCFEFACNPEEP